MPSIQLTIKEDDWEEAIKSMVEKAEPEIEGKIKEQLKAGLLQMAQAEEPPADEFLPETILNDFGNENNLELPEPETTAKGIEPKADTVKIPKKKKKREPDIPRAPEKETPAEESAEPEPEEPEPEEPEEPEEGPEEPEAAEPETTEPETTEPQADRPEKEPGEKEPGEEEPPKEKEPEKTPEPEAEQPKPKEETKEPETTEPQADRPKEEPSGGETKPQPPKPESKAGAEKTKADDALKKTAPKPAGQETKPSEKEEKPAEEPAAADGQEPPAEPAEEDGQKPTEPARPEAGGEQAQPDSAEPPEKKIKERSGAMQMLNRLRFGKQIKNLEKAIDNIADEITQIEKNIKKEDKKLGPLEKNYHRLKRLKRLLKIIRWAFYVLGGVCAATIILLIFPVAEWFWGLAIWAKTVEKSMEPAMAELEKKMKPLIAERKKLEAGKKADQKKIQQLAGDRRALKNQSLFKSGSDQSQ